MSNIHSIWYATQSHVTSRTPADILKQNADALDREEQRLLIKFDTEQPLPLRLVEIWILQAEDAMVRGRLQDKAALLQKARDGITGPLDKIERCDTPVKKAQFFNLRNQVFLLLGEELPVPTRANGQDPGSEPFILKLVACTPQHALLTAKR